MSTPKSLLAPLDYIPAEITCAKDYETLATRFIPADRFAYIAGGAGHDITLDNNSRAFQDFAITPRIFTDGSDNHTGIEILNQPFRHPIFLAPVAYQQLVYPEGELASAYAAAATDSGIVASTLSSFSLEQIAEKAGSERWFQLYLQPNPQDTEQLLERAHRADYRAIVVTVDGAVQLPSLRALRAGFVFPQEITAANLRGLGGAASPPDGAKSSASSRIFQAYRQNAVTAEAIQSLLEKSPLPILVKGVLNPLDAKRLQQMGVAGLVVSNHGGRTLDGVPASLSLLPAIRKTVGDEFPLLFDGGIRSGNDIFKALALGANAVLIGRLQLYALAVAGALGVAHLLKLLREELELAMAVTGCATVAAIRPEHLLRI